MKALPIVIIVIIAILGSYLYLNSYIPFLQPKLSSSSASNIDLSEKFVPYNNNDYNFSMSFPQTWIAETTPGELSYMQFIGPQDSSGNIENVQIYIFNQTITAEDANNATAIIQAQFSNSTLDSIKKTQNSYLISIHGESGADSFFVKDYLINCPGKGFEVIATIPFYFAAEVSAIDYMFSTFKCS